MKRLKQLQESLDLLFETVKESGSKVGITATISRGLNEVTQEIIRLMKAFSFDSRSVMQPAEHEMRRHPRAKNGPFSWISSDGQKVAEGITSDFSLSGVKLRLPEGSTMASGSLVTLYIMTPQASLEEYRHQQPLRTDARVIWSRTERTNTLYGLEFLNLTPAQEDRLEACFDYFKKSSRFPAEEATAV